MEGQWADPEGGDDTFITSQGNHWSAAIPASAFQVMTGLEYSNEIRFYNEDKGRFQQVLIIENDAGLSFEGIADIIEERAREIYPDWGED